MKTLSQPVPYGDLVCEMDTLLELDRLSRRGQSPLMLNDEDRALLIKHLMGRIDELEQLIEARVEK